MAMEPFLDPDEPTDASFPAHPAATSRPFPPYFSEDYDLAADSGRMGGNQPQYTDIFDTTGFEAGGAPQDFNDENQPL